MFKAPSIPILPLAFALNAAAGFSAQGQTIPGVPAEIVSAWKLNSGNSLLIFRHDGTYFQVQDDPARPGMERGTFIWNKAGGALTVTTLKDTNGVNGLSHPSGTVTISVGGNTLTHTVAGEVPLTYSRVIQQPGQQAIIGSWFIPGDQTTVTFLADGSYYSTEEGDEAPSAYDGMERGTYTWNPASGILTATPVIDTNGDEGLSNLPPGFYAVISGNAMTVPDDDETTTLRRITAITAPLNAEIDFEIEKSANHRQTSAAGPSLSTGGELPFRGEAYIENTVPGTAGSLTITGQAARTLAGDDGWGIEIEYATADALNASSAFPNNASYVFSRAGGSATLTFPLGGAFPAAPRITRNNDDDGMWIAGKYVLEENQTLIWDAHEDYDPATLITELSVEDPDTGEELVDDLIQGDITSFDFSGRLTPGRTYEVEIEQIRIASSTVGGTGPFAGKSGRAMYSSATSFTMVAPEGPASIPEITLQPVSQIPVQAAQTFLVVGSTGEHSELSYQWFKDGEPIPGQTGNSLFFRSFDLQNDSGRYNVAVSNGAGGTQSVPANLGNVGTETQAVTGLSIRKTRNHVQQSQSMVVATDFSFDADVSGYGLSTTFPSSVITLTKPDTTTIPLGTEDEDDDEGGVDWFTETDFASLSALQASFPNGFYRINIGSGSFLIDMTGDDFANVPIFTASAGTWVDGKLRISASQAAAGFNITSNESTGNAWIVLTVEDSVGEEIITEVVERNEPADPDLVSVDIGPSQLAVGQTYMVEASFDRVFDFEDVSDRHWAAPAPALTYSIGGLVSTTSFTIEVVADSTDGPYTNWQATYFNQAELADPAISGDGVDHDHDGVSNLLEFVLNGNPKATNSNILPKAAAPSVANGQKLVLKYTRNPSSIGVIQAVEHSANLSPPWKTAVHGEDGVIIQVDAITNEVTVSIPSVEGKRFARLKATR